MHKLFSVLTAAAAVSLSAPQSVEAHKIIETNTIENVLPLIDEETWFLVDLDNTLFQAKQALGHVNGLEHAVPPELAAYQLSFFNRIMSNQQALHLLSLETEIHAAPAEQNSTPEHLYKVISLEGWRESLLRNQIVATPIDKDFVHLAKEDQVEYVVHKFWNNADHIVLKLASKKLIGHLICEYNSAKTSKFYHLYNGSMPLESVVDVSIVKYR